MAVMDIEMREQWRSLAHIGEKKKSPVDFNDSMSTAIFFHNPIKSAIDPAALTQF